MERNAQHAFDAEEVMAYLDGELEARRATELAAHLVSCCECQEVAQGFRVLSERTLSFEVERPPAEISETVLAALDSRETSRKEVSNSSNRRESWKWRPLIARPYLWAFASLAIVALIFFASIPNLFRAREAAEPASRRASGYKSWLDKAGTAVTRSGSNVYQSSTETSETGTVAPESASPAPPVAGDELKAPETVGPMIAQTASLSIVATNYEEASAAIERLAAAHGGYVEKLTAKAQTGSARGLSAALRIPAKQLDGFLADLRKLGHVEEESRENEEVSAQYVDLQARLKSARATEQRLIELLGTRTGKLSEVLDAERELARIRGEIESMQGQNAILVHRVTYATVQVELSEEYRERLGTTSKGTKIWNALVEGLGNLEDGAVAALIFLLAYGPSILFWSTVLILPAWLIWRRLRRPAQT